jgi:hypothetical protein
MLVVAGQICLDAVMLEELVCMAGILSRDNAGLAQDTQCPGADVLQIADGGCDKI